jgi:hypothetical protein
MLPPAAWLAALIFLEAFVPLDRTGIKWWSTGASFCLVFASEAKQSIAPQQRRLDCFVAALLAMTE